MTARRCPAANGHLRLCPPPFRPPLGEEKGKAARPAEEGRRRNRCSGPFCGPAAGVRRRAGARRQAAARAPAHPALPSALGEKANTVCHAGRGGRPFQCGGRRRDRPFGEPLQLCLPSGRPLWPGGGRLFCCPYRRREALALLRGGEGRSGGAGRPPPLLFYAITPEFYCFVVPKCRYPAPPLFKGCSRAV